jgi:TetR/AcrR family transcriptional regulator
MAVDVAATVARKVTRNPEASRARILEAARNEFVSYGLSGARVDRIAHDSGVNKNLIYHYFGSKDALWKASGGWWRAPSITSWRRPN